MLNEAVEGKWSDGRDGREGIGTVNDERAGDHGGVDGEEDEGEGGSDKGGGSGGESGEGSRHCS